MNKKKETQRGITLIALVITIIVMLILVAVTISMAVNGGLFDYAGKATGETKNAIKAEQELSNGRIKVDEVWYDSIGDYLNEIPSENQNGGMTEGEDDTKTPTGTSLSGVWVFNDYVSRFSGNQEVNFTAVDGKLYVSIEEGYGDYNTYVIAKPFDYVSGNLDEVAGTYYNTPEQLPIQSNFKAIDFGNESQTVSQEFYEWFTANATKQQVATGTFTMTMGSSTQIYTYDEGMTWGDWSESDYNTGGFGFTDVAGNATKYLWCGIYSFNLDEDDVVVSGTYTGSPQQSG